MIKSFTKAALLGAVMTVALAGSAMAASGPVADQYLQNRIDAQNQRIQDGVAAGTITQSQADRQYGRDAIASHEIQNGHDLAAAKTLNKNSRRIYGTKHNSK